MPCGVLAGNIPHIYDVIYTFAIHVIITHLFPSHHLRMPCGWVNPGLVGEDDGYGNDVNDMEAREGW